MAPNVDRLLAGGKRQKLIKALGYRRDAAIRAAAADALRHLAAGEDDPSTVAEIVSALAKVCDDPDLTVQMAAVDSLCRIATDCAGADRALLEDSFRKYSLGQYPKVQERAVFGLSQVGGGVATGSTIDALRRLADPKSVDVLRRLLTNSEDGNTRYLAAEALNEIGWEPPRERSAVPLWMQLARHRADAHAIAGELADESHLDALIEIPTLDQSGIVAFGRRYPEALVAKLEELIAIVGTPDAALDWRRARETEARSLDLARRIVRALGILGNPIAVPALRRISMGGLGRSASSEGDAVQALGAIGDPSAVHALAEVVERDAREPVDGPLSPSDPAIYAAAALSTCNTPQAREALLGALDHENPRVANAVADALAELGEDRAIPALVERLHSLRAVGLSALETLGWTPTADVERFLWTLHTDGCQGLKGFPTIQTLLRNPEIADFLKEWFADLVSDPGRWRASRDAESKYISDTRRARAAPEPDWLGQPLSNLVENTACLRYLSVIERTDPQLERVVGRVKLILKELTSKTNSEIWEAGGAPAAKVHAETIRAAKDALRRIDWGEA